MDLLFLGQSNCNHFALRKYSTAPPESIFTAEEFLLSWSNAGYLSNRVSRERFRSGQVEKVFYVAKNLKARSSNKLTPKKYSAKARERICQGKRMPHNTGGYILHETPHLWLLLCCAIR